MRVKRKSYFVAGLMFALIFCLNSGAFGYVPPGEACLPSEVVFIDPSVQDSATIVAQLPQGALVVRLSPGTDGVAQISAHLAKKRDLSAIRIISHGNAGYFVLNGKRIDGDFLRDHGDRISPWGRALAENGTIDFLTSDLAASDSGNDLIQAVENLTANEVNASDDTTGSADHDGDWILEDGDVDAASKYFVSDNLESFDNEIAQVSELYIIDKYVHDIDTVVSELPKGSEIFYIENDTDGVIQITDALRNYSDLDTVHIISKGNIGKIVLGSTILNSDNMSDYQDAVTSWSNSFNENADILFYSCNTADGESGRILIDQIAEWSGTDIAASDDLTGLGGDWILEYQAGAIQSNSIYFNDYEYSLVGVTNLTELNTQIGNFNVGGGGDLLITITNNFNIDGDVTQITGTGTLTVDMNDKTLTVTAAAGASVFDFTGAGTLSFITKDGVLTNTEGTDGNIINVTNSGATLNVNMNITLSTGNANIYC